MLLVVRYVDGNGISKERVLEFIHCDTGTSGKALTNKIISSIRDDFTLDIMQCRDQCYDCVGNTAGRYSVVAARILEGNKVALYTKCASHRLTLCVAAALRSRTLRI